MTPLSVLKAIALPLLPAGIILPYLAVAQTDADRNFQNRCTVTGVVKCLGLDNTASGVTLMGGAKFDNAVKASGTASMRVDIAPSAGESPGNLTTKLGADFGEGRSLYLQWRQRFSPEMIDIDLGGEGFKQFVIYDGTPCGPNMEVAMLNQDFGGFPILYSACGSSYLRKSLGSGNYALMWNQDGTICSSQNKAGCLRYKADQWMTFYYEQKIGAWGQPNSVVRVSMAEENQPLKTFIDFSDYTFKSDQTTSAYRDIWVGPFSLGRTANDAYPMAQTWIDEVIISTQPIADPFEAGTGLRERMSARNPGGPKIHSSVSGSRITISLPPSDQPAGIAIYDNRGRRVRNDAATGGQVVEWDASAEGTGVYLVKVRIGGRDFIRKVSILQ